MRLTKEQAASNRQAILDAAARLFRERGFDAVSVADLMDAAGFTHGGFYNHFPSKEALAAEVTAASIRASAEALPRGAAGEKRTLVDYVASYLSPSHRDDPSRGCTVAALAADAGRQAKAIQSGFAEGIEETLRVLAAHLLEANGGKGKRAEVAARAEATRMWSEIVGALVLSRAVSAANPELSDAILEASRRGCTDALKKGL